MTSEFKVGQTVDSTDYAKLPVGAIVAWPEGTPAPLTKVGEHEWLGQSSDRPYKSISFYPRTLIHLPNAPEPEPEDADDAYVEPATEPECTCNEPLRADHPALINADKAGYERGWDAARAEFQTLPATEPEPLKEGAEHSVERALKATEEFAAAMQKWGEVVREAAEKFGAGLLHAMTTEPVEEPVGLGAVVEAVHRESDGQPDRLIRIGVPADDLAYPWYSQPNYQRYGWDELTNPKVLSLGLTERDS